MEKKVDVAILGAGTAGIDAMTEVRNVTDDFIWINGGLLGTTCARVGCMPSKVMIQVAEDFHRRSHPSTAGIGGGDLTNMNVKEALAYIRDLRDGFYSGVIEHLINPLRDKFIEGYAEFLEPNLIKVNDMTVRADRTIIATGSRPVVPKPWERFKDHILTTDTLFEQDELPQDMAVIGLGAIGLELGQALKRMGLNVVGFDLLEQIGGLRDPEVNRVAVGIIQEELPMHLGSAVDMEPDENRIRIVSDNITVSVDKVLLSMGRRPNIESLHLERLGIPIDSKGLPPFDRETMQVGDLPIFMAGDVNNYRPILHEASHEGLVAGYNAVNDPPIAFKRKCPLVMAFTDPNISIVGASWEEIRDQNPAVGTARFKGGRIKIMLREGGLIRIYADSNTGRLLGAEMAAPAGEHLGHLLAWSIQQEQTVFDLLEMPFYHPCVEETLVEALEELAERLDDGRPLIGFALNPES